MPYSEHLWRAKPSSYISHLVGHEGPNSLLSHLIRNGLAVGLSSSNSHRMTSIDQFTIDIALTEKGDIDPMKVIEEVFKYINKIRSERPREFVHLE